MIKKFRSLLDAEIKNHKVLVAAHRSIGCGNIIENTYKGCIAAWRAKANMVEIDVVKSIDGEYYVIHDGMEQRILGQEGNLGEITSQEIDKLFYQNINLEKDGKVEKLFDLLPKLKGKGLINIDRSWRYWNDKDFLHKLSNLDMNEQILLKAYIDDNEALDALENCTAPMLFMPIISSKNSIDELLARKINTCAFECIFSDKSSDLLNPTWQKNMKQNGIHFWVNAITLKSNYTLCAYHDDDNAVLEDYDKNWGWLIDNGFDIIQSDWPTLLNNYITQRS